MEFIGPFLFTAFIYAAFPICFSLFRKKSIRIRNYRLLCIGVSAVLCLSIQFLGAFYIPNYRMNFAPAILWTWISIAIGRYILDNKLLKAEAAAQGSTDKTDLLADTAHSSDSSIPEPPDLDSIPCDTQGPLSDANPETRYLLARDDGTVVWVPASKLDEFDPSDTEISIRQRQFAEQMTADLIQKYGNAPQPDKSKSRAAQFRSAEDSTSRKKSGVPLWIVIVLVLIIGILIGVLAAPLYYSSSSSSRSATADAFTPTPAPTATSTIKPTPTPKPTTDPTAQRPRSGTVLTEPKSECLAPFTLDAPGSVDCFVWLHNLVRSSNDISIYVRAGESASTDVPLGSYTMYYATGTEWEGLNAPKKMVFGKDTKWFKAEREFRFTEDDEYYYGHTVSLNDLFNLDFNAIQVLSFDLPF